MRIVVLLASLLAGFSISAFGQTELIVNGGFEQQIQNEWHISGIGVDVRANSSLAHSGAGYLKMGEVPTVTEVVYQTLTLPTNTIAAVLSYWRDISCPQANDGSFAVFITDTNLNILTNVESVAVNANGAKGTAFYTLSAFDATPFAGQTVAVAFRLFTGNVAPNSAYVALDDISFLVETTADIAPNDYFTNRTTLTGNTATGINKNTFATKETGEPNHAGNSGGRSVWWRWTAPGDGVLNLDTQGSDFSTLLAVYTGSAVSNLTSVASDDSSQHVEFFAHVNFPVRAGTEYEIAVDGVRVGDAISFGNAHLNLTFTPDTTPPKVTISSPKQNARLTTGSVTVQGTAVDNVAVARVEFRVENAAGTNSYQLADGTNHWVATVNGLAPGPNTIRVRAFDTVSNVMAVTRTVNFVVLSPINVIITGSGTVSPDYDGSSLEVGKSYTVTAKPSPGNVFSNWTGGVLSSDAKLTFIMQSNMTLQANFILNPFIAVKGAYAGLFYGTNGISTTNAGYFSANVSDKGTFTAKVIMPAATTSVSGKLALDGSFSNAIARPGGSLIQFQGQVDLNGGDVMTGQFTIGNQTADLVANRAVFSKTSSPPQAGKKYTVVIPGSDDPAAAPGGDGYGTATVDASGNITFTGVLGDGTKVSQKTFISKDGWWPFFAAPYAKTGLIVAWLQFDMNDANNGPLGEFTWMRLPSAAAKNYPLGFYSHLDAEASLYTFSPGTSLFTWTDGQVVLQGGNLSPSVTNTFTIDANNKVTSPDGLKLTFSTATGTFKGTFIHPDTQKPVPISGAILENQDAGFGVFLGTDQTGSVTILAQ